MAVTNQQSLQTQTMAQRGGVLLNPAEDRDKLRVARVDFTQSGVGDIASTMDLIRLPSGRVRVMMGLSRLACSAFGAARTLNIGHTGFVKGDNTVQVAVPAAFVSAWDVSAAIGFLPVTGSAVGVDQTALLDARDEVLVQAVLAGGTVPDGATIKGFICYVKM